MAQPNYPEILNIKMPAGFLAALSILAQRQYSTTAEIARRAFITLLNEAGIEIDPMAPPPGSKAAKSRVTEAAE